ncbi:MAG: NnrU family protein, partial [Gammaproteobacteria bacterium]|nr:NnrU family protein [Gammaproteobacteria bacterium]
IGEGSGLVRITRHPFQWAVVLWSASHIVAGGDSDSLVFFGSFGAVSLFGTFLMDRKKARQLGPDWQSFANATSNIPFAAIIAGRNRLVVKELWQPVVVGLAGYALLLWGHEFVSGVPLL